VKTLRGYISSRKFMGETCHQSTQNLVLRDYCDRMKYKYLLSGTEYSINNSYLMLQQLVLEIPDIDGIVAYSLFQLPENQDRRLRIINDILDRNGELHFALESMKISDKSEIERLEKIWLVRKTIPTCITNLNS
jgi:sporadic carbohydrate cluster protein (TIGR04323 family)